MINIASEPNPRTIVESILPVLPTGLPLETLAVLNQIEFRADIPTAAILEENGRFLMAINRDFLSRYAPTRQRQTLLVMHELMHLLLGHTRHRLSYREAGLAFDAVINSGLVRLFPGPEYTGLLTDLYSTEFPEVLLRPIDYSNVELDDEILSIHRRLYHRDHELATVSNASHFVTAFGANFTVLYQEIMDLIQQRSAASDGSTTDGNQDVIPGPSEDIMDFLRKAQSSIGENLDFLDQEYLLDNLTQAQESVTETPSGAPLLGNHSRPHGSDAPSPGPGRGLGKRAKEVIIQPQSPGEESKRVFSAWLKRLVHHELERLNWPRPELAYVSTQGTIPNARDRYGILEYRIQKRPVMWDTPVKTPTQVPPDFCSLFIDVSASMDAVLPQLIALLAAYMSQYQYEMWQFSNVVEPLHLEMLKRGILASSRGTDLACALSHIVRQKQTRPVSLVISDADFKPPNTTLLRKACRRTRLHFLITGTKALSLDVRQFAASVRYLP